MSVLAREYTDTKNKTHKVEHIVLSADNRNSKEQILEELFRTLTKVARHTTT